LCWCVPEDSNLSSANLPVSQTPVLRTGGRTRTPRLWCNRTGGGLRVRTSVPWDPSVFETDCQPLQRSPPSATERRVIHNCCA